MLVEQLMERRANLENPSNALATEWDFLAESAGHAGVAVDEKKSLSSTAIFRAVRLLAETEASIPLHVYEQQERGKRLARTHPVYPVVHTAPNPEMSAMNFRESLMAHLVVWGDAYAEIVRDRGGRVRQLWPLLPDRTHRARDASGNPVIRTVVDGKRIEMPFERVLHIPGIGFDGRSGWGIIDLATEAVGLTLATEKFGAKFFGSGSHLGGVIEHPERMSDKSEKHLRRSWERMHSGLENAHRVAILEEGSSFNQIGVPPEAAQFLETRKFQVNEIARLTGVQPHLLMDLERATFDNIEQQSLEFVKYSLRPWLVRIEQALNQQVIGARKDFFAEHVVEGLLRGDSEQRAEFFKTMFQNGVFTINDILEKENMNPAPPEIGERRMVRRDMIPVDRIDDLVDRLPADSRREQAGADETATRGAARAFEDAFGRMVRAECQEHRGELPRIFAEEGVEGWREYLEDFYGDGGRMAGIVERTVGPTARAWAEAFAEDRLSDLEVRTLVASDDGYVSDLSDRYQQASRDLFMGLCEEEEPRCATEEQLSAWMDDERPDHIQQLATREARRLRGRVMEAYEAKRLRPERGST